MAASASAAQAALPSALDSRIEAIELAGRGQPLAAAADVERLLQSSAAFSSEQLELLTAKGELLAAARQADAARALLRSLDAWRGTVHADDAATAALLVAARIEIENGNMRTADGLLVKTAAGMRAGAPARLRLRILAAHAGAKKELGELEQAMRLYQEALAAADALGQPNWRVDMRCGLARVYLQAGQPAHAERLNREALVIAEASGDHFLLYEVHGTEGVLLDAANDSAGVRREFEAALEQARLAHAPSAESLALSNLSDGYLKNGDYKTALAMAQKAIALTRQLGDTDGQVVSLFNAGVALIALHEIELGKRHVAESIAIDERRGALSSMSVSYNELGSYLERAGDAAGAVLAFHRYRDLTDAIVRRDEQKALIELQEHFDAERRSRELDLLGRQNALQAEQLHRQALQQDLWWLLAGLCAASLAVLWWLHRRVRSANTLLAASNRELAMQGERDPLTGLANRRHFHGAMASADAQGFASALFLIDIDHFKSINDRHGHAAGDGVLVEVAQRLSAMLDSGDLAVRWGGEEFLVAIRNRRRDDTETIAERLLTALNARPFAVQGHTIEITASIGYASFPLAPLRLPVSVERAVQLVDAALYLAKSNGRNRACGISSLLARGDGELDAAASALGNAAADGRAVLASVRGRLEMAA